MSFFGNRRQAETTFPQTTEKEQQQPPVSSSPAPRPIPGFETILGANCTMEGTLRSNDNVRLDGTFTGTLEIAGNILVGETAKINADINAKNISIAGAVHGNITGKKVQLLRTGRIWGDIRAVALTTEEGAFIDGKINMMSPENPVPPQIEAPSIVNSFETADITADAPLTETETIAASDDPQSSMSSVEDEIVPEGESPENRPL
jgi:cytoskeletal protein CcmA (bactofilin family)